MQLSRIPVRVTFDQQLTTMISTLLRQARDEEALKSLNEDMSLKRVLGYPLPSWQRGLVWSDEQSIRFIESVYSGVHLGTFVYNSTVLRSPFQSLLIDGQQRLHAIERYAADGFAVKGQDGIARLWSELTEQEQRHFGRMPFGFSVVKHEDEASLVSLYNLLNFGGVAHDENDRASLPA